MTLICQSCEGAKGWTVEREVETNNYGARIFRTFMACDECGDHEFPGEQPCQWDGCTKSATTDSYMLVCDDHIEDAEAEREAQKAYERCIDALTRY